MLLYVFANEIRREWIFKMKIIKALFSIIFTSIFSISLFFIATFGIVNSIISKEYIMDKIDKSGIYEELENETKKIANNYIVENTEAEKVFDEFATKENIKDIAETFSDLIYADANVNIEELGIDGILKENVNRIKNEYNIILSDNEQKELDEFIEDVSEAFKQKSTQKNVNNESASQGEFINVIPLTLKVMKSIYSILIAVTVVLGIILIAMNLKSRAFGFDYIASGFLISGIALVSLKGFLKRVFSEKSLIENANITDTTSLHFIASVFKDLSDSFGKWGGVFVALGIFAIFAVIVVFIINKNKTSNSRKR